MLHVVKFLPVNNENEMALHRAEMSMIRWMSDWC